MGEPEREESRGGETLAGISPRDSHKKKLQRFARAHARSVAESEYITEIGGDYKVASKLMGCGSWLLFRHYFQVDEYRLHKANFCKQHLLCPLCAVRRAAKAVEVYKARLDVIIQDDPSLVPYMVTFTVVDGPDLVERFDHLRKSLQTYGRQRRNATLGKRAPVEMNKAAGGVWSHEVKRGKGSGEWHPHAHGVWLCHEAPDQWKISEEWHQITGDSFVVDVRPIEDDVISGFVEVFKYAVKFADLTVEDNWMVYKFLKRKRLVTSFGCFRGVEIPEELTDDPIEGEPFVQLFYRYLDGMYVQSDQHRSYDVSA